MKNVLRKFAVAGVGTLLLGGMAFAAVGNDHTGYESDNDASVSQKNHSEIENSNAADIWNQVKGMANTGDNKANENTEDGDVVSGNVRGTVSITNAANDNDSRIEAPAMGSASVSNSHTGAESENDAWVKMENSLKIENENEADVHNCVAVNAETGDNKANSNTGDGSVHTGYAVLDIAITNTLNTNDSVVK